MIYMQIQEAVEHLLLQCRENYNTERTLYEELRLLKVKGQCLKGLVRAPGKWGSIKKALVHFILSPSLQIDFFLLM